MRLPFSAGRFRDAVRRIDVVAICALTTVACIVALVARRDPQPPLPAELRARLGASLATIPSTPGSLARPSLDAYVVFQLADCTGNLRLLDLLRRRSVRGHVRLAGLVFAGTDDELERARQRLPPSARGLPIRRASRTATDLLTRLGYRSTPIVVVLDAEHRVRFITGAPTSALAYVRLARLLPNLDHTDAP